jgi:hypothetical protein
VQGGPQLLDEGGMTLQRGIERLGRVYEQLSADAPCSDSLATHPRDHLGPKR